MKKLKSLLLLLMSFSLALPGFAQESGETFLSKFEAMDTTQLTLLIILAVVLGVIVLLLILMIYLMTFMAAVFKKESATKESTVVAIEEGPTWWHEFKLQYITGKMKPVGGKEEQQMLLDHNYDGIVELDNHMPPWLVNVFYLTIAFAVVYFSYYTVLGLGANQIEEYAEEQRIAAVEIEAYNAKAVSSIDESTVVFDSSTPALEAGSKIYMANCVACHAADGGGGVGPNLTDSFWIHGGSIEDIFKVVKYGVVEKGMIPWQDQLTPEAMQQVSSYILTLVGTTPTNPKAPQGEEYTPSIEKPIDALKGEELGLEKVESKD